MQGIIHGDIKPQNVLVFENNDGGYFPRVADFGFSTHFHTEDDLVYVPESVPWTAPERTHRAFTPASARKMDIYSFGMLCMWVLFGCSPDLEPPLSLTLLPGQFVDFNHPLHELNRLRYLQRGGENGLHDWAVWLATQRIEDPSVRDSITVFFRLSLPKDPLDRCDNFGRLLDLLGSNLYVH
jgi:serine/threonine protein kinase